MNNIEFPLYGFTILILMVLISKFYDYYILKRMRDTIEYCALRYTPVHISNCGDLVFNELNRVLPPEYQISKSEEKYVDEIYSKYRVHIMKSFFMASEFSWRTSHMRHEEYFFRTFGQFLHDNECEQYAFETPMFQYLSTVNNYTKLYSLTDFGIVYHKVYLGISMLLNQIDESVYYNGIIENLKNKQIEIMRYMP